MSSKLATSIILLLCIASCYCQTMPVVTYDSQGFFCFSKPTCQMCRSDFFNKEICFSCQQGYILQNNECVYDSSQSINNNGQQITIPFCMFEILNTDGILSCSSCQATHELRQIESGAYNCQYHCSSPDIYVIDPNDCQSTCYQPVAGITTGTVNNCKTCYSGDRNTCKTCVDGFYLENRLAQYNSYDYVCLKQCETGFYANSNQECVKCPPQCKECTSDAVCTSCNEVILSTPAPSCQCPWGSYYFNNDCLKEAPINHILVDGQYKRICQFGTYPLYQEDGSILCTQVYTQENNYCIGILSKLKQIISIELPTQTDPDNLYFNLKLFETPGICFDFQVTGLNDQMLTYYQANIYPITIPVPNTSPYYFSPSIAVRKSDFQDPEKVSCTKDSCIINLKVRWNGQTQLVYAINLNLSLNYVLSNTISQTSSPDQIDIVCQTCEIPNELKTPSVLQIKCSEGQVCSGDSMQVTSGSLIEVTQTVSDDSLKTNKLLPHSLVMTGYSDPENLSGNFFTYQIKEYTFDNSILGQITYSFRTISFPKINVVITSYFKNTITPGRMLTTSSDTVNYPQMHFQINVVTHSSEESKIGMYIGIAVGIAVVAAILGGFLIFYIRKLKKQAKNTAQLPTKEIVVVTEEQGLQLEDAKRFTTEPIEVYTPEK